jgi:hypothetical protein
MQDPEISESTWRHIAKPVIFVAIVLALLGVRMIRDAKAKAKTEEVLIAAKWAGEPTSKWPSIALVQRATFKTRTEMRAGVASLVELPNGEQVMLTAAHLLGTDGDVNPPLIEDGIRAEDLRLIDEELVDWSLSHPQWPSDAVMRVAGVFGPHDKYRSDCDQLLFRLNPGSVHLEIAALRFRTTPAFLTERVFVIGVTNSPAGFRQAVLPGKVLANFGVFVCRLDTPQRLQGFSGAPVVDERGLLLGIVAGSALGASMSDGREEGFTAHSVKELLPVLAHR